MTSPQIPFISKLLDRLPADHPGRERLAQSGRLLTETLAEIGRKVASADAATRKETARRLRQILDFIATGRPIERVLEVYEQLRACNFESTPWGALNAVLEEAYGEDALELIKQRAAPPASSGRTLSPGPAASINRRRVRRKHPRG